MQAAVQFYEDVVKGLIKSVVFVVVVTWIMVYQGYDSVPTSEGITGKGHHANGGGFFNNFRSGFCADRASCLEAFNYAYALYRADRWGFMVMGLSRWWPWPFASVVYPRTAKARPMCSRRALKT